MFSFQQQLALSFVFLEFLAVLLKMPAPKVLLVCSASACGGDGTVGWILSVMDEMEFGVDSRGRDRRPCIAIIPLGTGNDLSRSLEWGGKYRDKPLRKVLIDIAKADVIYMDRWSVVDNYSHPQSSNLAEAAARGDGDSDSKLVQFQFSIPKHLQYGGIQRGCWWESA